jgi:hypothetical protein
MNSSDDTYNGWTNWETWLVNLWIDNDQGLYEHCLMLAREEISANTALADGSIHPLNKKLSAINLSGILREQFDEWAPDVEGLYRDLMNGALRDVNYLEIATHLSERVEEEDTYAERAN